MDISPNWEVETITTKQLAGILQIGETRASQTMNAIKSVSDTLGITGLCHKQDYEYWKAQRLGKVKQNFDKGVCDD